MGSIILLYLIIGILALIYHYLTRSYSYWKDRGLPHLANPKTLFGSYTEVLTFKINIDQFYDRIFHEYKRKGEKYVGLYLFQTPVLLPIDPDLVREIMTTNFQSFHGRPLSYDEKFDPMTASLLNVDGTIWKFIRGKLSPAFTPAKVKTTFDIVKEVTRRAMKPFDLALETNSTVDIYEAMTSYAMDVIIFVAFGLELNTIDERQTEFKKMVDLVIAPSRLRRLMMNLTTAFPRLYKLFKLRRISAEITDFFVNCFRDTADFRVKNNVTRNDFLQLLMNLRQSARDPFVTQEGSQDGANQKNNPIELTDEILTAQLFFFILAGFDTTSLTLTYVTYELALNPDFQERAAKEVEDALANHGGLTYEALNHMKFLDSLIYESLRKYPPVVMIPRRCNEKFKIPGTNSFIDPDAVVHIPVYSLHHDPQFHPDPETFNPDRFSDSNRNDIIPGSYIPFGDGPRLCLGKKFAIMEMKVLLSKLLSKFRFIRCPETKILGFEKGSLTLTPTNRIRAHLEARK